MAELRTVRVELFGLGGRERSGSFGAVGGGPEDLEAPKRSLLVPVGPCKRYPTAAPRARNVLASVLDWVLGRLPPGSCVFCNKLNIVIPNQTHAVRFCS